MDGTNGLKETRRMTAPAPVASNPPAVANLSVNVFTAPGKPMVGERPKPFGEPLGFDPMTATLIFGEHDAVLVDAMTTVAEAEALATVVIASTSTASCSPKIKVAVIGSKPSGSPKGFGRSPTIGFPGAVKTFTLRFATAGGFDATGAGAVMRLVSFSPFVPSIGYSFRCQSE